MRPEERAPEVREDGKETHPAWGVIGASRVTGSARLFDSDINHHHFVVVQISRASRKRDLSRDWIHPEREGEIAEVAMSEAQWASFVSSMNAGSGVPCTIERTEVDGRVPSFPAEPRLAESMKEVRAAAKKAQERVAAAFAAYEEKKNVANLRSLRFAIEGMPNNIEFAAQSLTEHAENVVQRARADIEAMVIRQAQALGVDPGEIAPVALGAGDDE